MVRRQTWQARRFEIFESTCHFRIESGCPIRIRIFAGPYYKDTQMKAYNITKLTAELKSSDTVQYRNKINYFVGGLGGRDYRKHVSLYAVKLSIVRWWFGIDNLPFGSVTKKFAQVSHSHLRSLKVIRNYTMSMASVRSHFVGLNTSILYHHSHLQHRYLAWPWNVG